MTNLALKGIIGVKAMAEISRAVGKDSDAQEYDVRLLLRLVPCSRKLRCHHRAMLAHSSVRGCRWQSLIANSIFSACTAISSHGHCSTTSMLTFYLERTSSLRR